MKWCPLRISTIHASRRAPMLNRGPVNVLGAKKRALQVLPSGEGHTTHHHVTNIWCHPYWLHTSLYIISKWCDRDNTNKLQRNALATTKQRKKRRRSRYHKRYPSPGPGLRPSPPSGAEFGRHGASPHLAHGFRSSRYVVTRSKGKIRTLQPANLRLKPFESVKHCAYKQYQLQIMTVLKCMEVLQLEGQLPSSPAEDKWFEDSSRFCSKCDVREKSPCRVLCGRINTLQSGFAHFCTSFCKNLLILLGDSLLHCFSLRFKNPWSDVPSNLSAKCAARWAIVPWTWVAG